MPAQGSHRLVPPKEGSSSSEVEPEWVEALTRLAQVDSPEQAHSSRQALEARFPRRCRAYAPLLDALVARAEDLERWKQLAGRDPLTGIANRRAFQEELLRGLARVRRHGGSLGVVLLDLDDLKLWNDRYGHPVGDEALIRVARSCERGVRSSDLVARIGGDEFAVLLTEADAVGARIAALRLRGLVERERVAGRPVRVSVGSASSSGHLSAEQLLEQADQDLYRDKMARRRARQAAQESAKNEAWHPFPGEGP